MEAGIAPRWKNEFKKSLDKNKNGILLNQNTSLGGF